MAPPFLHGPSSPVPLYRKEAGSRDNGKVPLFFSLQGAERKVASGGSWVREVVRLAE